MGQHIHMYNEVQVKAEWMIFIPEVRTVTGRENLGDENVKSHARVQQLQKSSSTRKIIDPLKSEFIFFQCNQLWQHGGHAIYYLPDLN